MKQSQLPFENQNVHVAPTADRPAPKLWIRHLALSPGMPTESEPFRVVEFRRGLNVIATARHPGDSTPTVGHSVGKSLLLRLIRYCLGERTYGTPAVRSAIARDLNRAFVTAEFDLDGEVWRVTRPLGGMGGESQSRCWTTSGLGMADEDAMPFGIFIDRLQSVIAQSCADVRLPKANRELHWLDILGWLSRDQSCRYRSHVEWRPTSGDVGNRGLPVEDCHVIVRAMMDLLSSEDADLIVDRKALSRERGRLFNESSRCRIAIESLQSTIAGGLQLAEPELPCELFVQTALNMVQSQIASLQRLLDEETDDDEVAGLELRLQELDQGIGKLTSDLQHAEGQQQAANLEIQSIEDADIVDSLGEIPWCRLFDSKDDALNEGCPGVSKQPQGRPSPHSQRRKRQLQADLERLQTEIPRLRSRVEELTGSRDELAMEVQSARRAVALRGEPIRERIADYRAMERQTQVLGRRCSDLARLNDQINATQHQLRQSLDSIRERNRRFRAHRRQLSDALQYVLSAVLGTPIGARVDVRSDGIFPVPDDEARSRGDAMATSTTVLGFDLACLVASIAGLGQHPRFLMHDSPREADLEEELYHRLFRMIVALERLYGDSDPGFQYITTTTSPPPGEIDCEPYVRLRLDARRSDGLFLKQRF